MLATASGFGPVFESSGPVLALFYQLYLEGTLQHQLIVRVACPEDPGHALFPLF
jgi:hypothetical protein